jgi:hypothetical protein
MKYCLCILLIAAMRLPASDGEGAAGTKAFVRLVKVSHSGAEVQSLVATFEPIRIDYGGGGARGAGSFPPPSVETVIGKPFTVIFIRQAINAHEQTLWHVIQSCASKRGMDAGALKLHLVLSIPTEATKQLSSDADRDFSEWVIMSVDALK